MCNIHTSSVTVIIEDDDGKSGYNTLACSHGIAYNIMYLHASILVHVHHAYTELNLFTDIVLIGFEKTSFTVNEGVTDGLQEVCVRVFNPTDNQPLSANIALTIQSAPTTGICGHIYLLLEQIGL